MLPSLVDHPEGFPEPFLKRDEIARAMGVSVRTIDYWSKEGCPFETWGLKTKVFRASLVMDWARQRAERTAAA